MCSIGEDDFGDEGGLHSMECDLTNLKLENETNNGICRKCNTGNIVVKINFREAECKECFFSYIRHKFRATLGLSKLLPKDAEVLVVIDGSPESIVLLDILYYSLKQDNFKRLRCNVKVLHVDNYFLQKTTTTNEENHNTIEKIKTILDNYNLETYFLSLAFIQQNPMKFDEYNKSNLYNQEINFMKILDDIRTTTSKQDFILKTTKNRIVSAAKYLNCKFIFTPNISSDLATTFLMNIALGAGASVASDVSLMDNRNSDVKIIRPIKDLTQDEIFNYLHLNNLKYLNITKYGENETNSSIQNLTKSFVQNLQKNFPSTVSTVFRTGDKISNRSFSKSGKNSTNNSDSVIENHQIEKCNFCNSEIDYINSDALEAIKFSKLVSTNTIKPTNEKDVNNIDLSLTKTEDVPKNLCHTCKNIFQDSSCKDFFLNL